LIIHNFIINFLKIIITDHQLENFEEKKVKLIDDQHHHEKGVVILLKSIIQSWDQACIALVGDSGHKLAHCVVVREGIIELGKIFRVAPNGGRRGGRETWIRIR